MRKLLAGLVLYAILLLPPVASLLENHMVSHMLIQMPLLIISGLFIGTYLRERYPAFFKKWNGSGIPGITLVYLITMYWMLPRAMDEAITLYSVELFKYISLPIFTGIALRDSWPRLSGLLKGFIIFNYLPMFGIMSWLYIDTPIQVCNNYLESEQKMLGWAFFFVTICMLFYIIQYVFTDQSEKVS